MRINKSNAMHAWIPKKWLNFTINRNRDFYQILLQLAHMYDAHVYRVYTPIRRATHSGRNCSRCTCTSLSIQVHFTCTLRQAKIVSCLHKSYKSITIHLYVNFTENNVDMYTVGHAPSLPSYIMTLSSHLLPAAFFFFFFSCE